MVASSIFTSTKLEIVVQNEFALEVSIPVFFTAYMTGGANGMTSVVSCKNQKASYRGKFRSREIKFSWSLRGIRVIRVRVIRVKVTKK